MLSNKLCHAVPHGQFCGRCRVNRLNDAVNMVEQERIRWEATILHADHGTQFTSCGFGENLRRWGLLESFGTVVNCFDNAVMEAFWGRLQTELLNTKKWSTTLELTAAMADHIDNFPMPNVATAISAASARSSTPSSGRTSNPQLS